MNPDAGIVEQTRGSPRTPTERRRQLALFMIGCLALTLTMSLLGTWWLPVHGLESSIGLGAEHMLRRGEWFVPKLYGTVHAYKPALSYWLAAASINFLGRSEVTLRLPSALCGAALGLVTLGMLARLVSSRCGLYACLAIVTSVLFIEQGRIAGCDMPLALGIGTAILCAARNLSLRRPTLLFWSLAYAGLLFAFLAKGMPALGVFLPGLLVAAVVTGQTRQLLSWQHALAALAAVLSAGGYLYLAWRQEGAVALDQQWGEVTRRAALWNLAVVGRTLLKPGIIWVLFLPGSALLLFWLAPGRRNVPGRHRRLARIFWSFLLTGLAVWLLTPTYSSRYYLPLVTPVGVLAGLAAEAISPGAFRRDPRGSGPARGARLREAWLTYHPGMVITFWGVVFWLVFAAVIQPMQVAARLELRAVTRFIPHLTSGEDIYLDGFVTALATRCGSRTVHYWNPNEPLPCKRFLLVFIEKQRAELLARKDLHVEILETRQINASYPWTVARISSAAGSAAGGPSS